MDEDVLPIFALDKAKPFPALNHFTVPVSFMFPQFALSESGPPTGSGIGVRGMPRRFLPLFGLLSLGRASFSVAAHVLFGEGQCADFIGLNPLL